MTVEPWMIDSVASLGVGMLAAIVVGWTLHIWQVRSVPALVWTFGWLSASWLLPRVGEPWVDRPLTVWIIGLVVFLLPPLIEQARAPLAALPWDRLWPWVQAGLPDELDVDPARVVPPVLNGVFRAWLGVSLLSLVLRAVSWEAGLGPVVDPIAQLLGVALAALATGVVGFAALGAWRRSSGPIPERVGVVAVGALVAITLAGAMPLLVVLAVVLGVVIGGSWGVDGWSDLFGGMRLRLANERAPLRLTVDGEELTVIEVGTWQTRVRAGGSEREVPNRELAKALDAS